MRIAYTEKMEYGNEVARLFIPDAQKIVYPYRSPIRSILSTTRA